MGLLDRIRLAWQRLEDFFDRRILTFGFTEQLGALTALGDAARWTARRAASGVGAAILGAAFLIVWLWIAAARRRRSGRRPPATRAVLRLGRRLARAGVEVPAAATLGWICGEAGRRWPDGAADIARLRVLAEREMYGPDGSAAGAGGREVRLIRARLRTSGRG
jgi:hypothetical protein